MRVISVKLFGAFRNVVPDGKIQIEVHETSTIKELRGLLERALVGIRSDFDARLISDSAFANEREILSDSEPVVLHKEIAVLPPVCGG